MPSPPSRRAREVGIRCDVARVHRCVVLRVRDPAAARSRRGSPQPGSPHGKPLEPATSSTILIRCASRRAVSGFAVQIGERQENTSG